MIKSQWYIPVGLILMIGLAYLSMQVINGARVVSVFPDSKGPVGPYTRIGIKFNQAMQTESVLAAFHLDPPVSGTWQWEELTAWFVPDKPLNPGIEYTAHLQAGATSVSGHKVLRSKAWSFLIRDPQIAYLSPVYGPRDLWSIPSGGGEPVRLTTTANVLDYSVSKYGEQIAYSIQNPSGGADLWLMERDGSQPKRLVDCDADACLEPTWTPDGTRIAYVRAHGPITSSTPAGEIWVAQVGSGEISQLERADAVPANRPAWSPNGNRLAFFIPTKNEFYIVSQKHDPEVRLETTQEGAAAWLPGQDRLAFLLANSTGVVPFSGVGIYDFGEKRVQKLFGGNPDDPDFSLPAWSPDGEWLLTSQREPGGNPARQLWLYQADGTRGKPITDDPTSNSANYRWDAWGRKVLFLQVKIGVADVEPQVMVWDRESGQVTKIADGTLPEWLP